MSSPRKYASPYLTGMPSLPSATNKVKKRSKASLTKLNGTQAETDSEDAKSNSKNSTNDSAAPPRVANQDPTFDASCGDMDQKGINDIITGTKSLAISPAKEEEKIKPEQNGAGEGNAAADSSNICFDSTYESTENTDASNQLSNTIEVVTLKSILKKPSIYRIKSKSKDIQSDGIRKHSKHSKSGKTTVKDNFTRVQSKHKSGAASVSSSKAEMKTPHGGNLKSPRRRGKEVQVKTEEKDEALLLPKKSVRFCNKVDVHPVPYESRAGTRACDWQRNMLEQRVQTFRQLMQDVGTDEIDLFGSGMLFPGYPYHVPNPNFALRGSRIRNFKL